MQDDSKREIGTVAWFKDSFGFVRPDSGGKDVFVHHTAIEMDGYKTLKEGQRVSFVVERGQKGPEAREVQILHK